VDLGYARVSTVKQDLDRQIDALEQVGIPCDRIYLDKKSGATTDRPRSPTSPKPPRAQGVALTGTTPEPPANGHRSPPLIAQSHKQASTSRPRGAHGFRPPG
jgi:hypothetical protein